MQLYTHTCLKFWRFLERVPASKIYASIKISIDTDANFDPFDIRSQFRSQPELSVAI